MDEFRDCIKYEAGPRPHLYHGTKKTIASVIISDNYIKPGITSGYLGYGVYCYDLDHVAAKLWAKKRFPKDNIAVLRINADLGTLLFVSKEIYTIVNSRALKIKEDFGEVLEEIIINKLESIYGIIHTVARNYHLNTFTESRDALMYSIRKDDLVKNISLFLEE